jgi:tetratricopeptide (TPR) repeat protein
MELAAFLLMALLVDATASPVTLDRLGRHTFPVTTTSKEAQRAFDRGLTLAYSFGHYAAEQEFRRALAADPNCAMAYWGIALVNGPHINFPLVPPPKAAAAWAALTNAQALAAPTTPLEQSLIQALSTRYANPPPEDRSALEAAYAHAMRELWKANPDNADIGTLFVEAAMDLHPWDLWKAGQPQPWTPEIIDSLEAILRLSPRHPGANHLYIHAVEASPHPEKAVPAADRLGKLVPDSSHMVHMPAHIYARVSRWEDAAEANRRAMKADARYRAAYPRPGFYALYMAHNAHFLTYVTMMQGRSAESIRLAREVVSGIPEDFLRDYPGIADGFMIFASEVLMRFGRWEAILAEPKPPASLPLSIALWHFTRAVALTALDRPDEALKEKAAFATATAAVPAGYTFGNNLAAHLLAIAGLVLDGEMQAKAGHYDESIATLRKAVAIEDTLFYDEPPDWIQPVRHTLGAVLLRASKLVEAEQVYREDLVQYPGNGWSLMGLRDSLNRQGRTAEARKADAQLRKAWAKTDIKPNATCFCLAAPAAK